MAGKRTLLALIALLLASAPLAAQPSIVNIQLRPGGAGEPRVIEITPNVAAVCRNTSNCPTELDYRWVGSAGSDPTERISVYYHDGLFWDEGKPGTVPAANCFDFPGGSNPFTLEHGPANGLNLIFKADANDETCPDKVAFFFDISCQNEAGDHCGGVETLDPGTMVDNGRR